MSLEVILEPPVGNDDQKWTRPLCQKEKNSTFGKHVETVTETSYLTVNSAVLIPQGNMFAMIVFVFSLNFITAFLQENFPNFIYLET